MKKLILTLTLLLPAITFAATEGPALEKAPTNINDKAALQAGAKLFVNYCMGCHSANYARFERVGKDLGLTEDEVKQYLMFTADKIGETMTIPMKKEEAINWFGVAPPDLSVTARSRGVDWLYTYLLSFYEDPSRPNGVNNLVFRDVAMPHVLWELQGWQKPVYETVTDEVGQPHQVIKSLQLVNEAKDKDKVAKYRQDVLNLVTFLEYLGEPAKLERQRLGLWVLIYLVILLIFAYLLKKEYWRDVH
jgi:ubiquinol-cytochrome c reductase cytochrome c1 subunit